MQKQVSWLGAILALQLSLFLFLSTKQAPTAVFQPTEPLISIDLAQADSLTLKGSSGEVLLKKQEGKWRIPELFNFPVNMKKLDDLLTRVKDFKQSLPVGRTKIAAKQFRVIEDAFERKLVFGTSDQPIAALYLGDSPSFKKVYARIEGSDVTHVVSMSPHDIMIEVKSWMDRDVLKLNRTEVSRIELPTLTLVEKGGQFMLTDVPTGKATNLPDSSELAESSYGLIFEDLLGLSSETTKGAKVFEYTITYLEGLTRTYSFYESQKQKPSKGDMQASPTVSDDQFVVEASDLSYSFTVTRERVKKLMEATPQNYLKDLVDLDVPDSQTRSSGEKGAALNTEDESAERQEAS